ncbi:hypothetical protein R1flu_004509 [Riccia fluitans]|uniref:Lon N-terminal domain-containing protein n=1 Tax=Riccia fluitans TaxID=41844 RepID=A0ABD1YQV6_9MARC
MAALMAVGALTIAQGVSITELYPVKSSSAPRFLTTLTGAERRCSWRNSNSSWEEEEDRVGRGQLRWRNRGWSSRRVGVQGRRIGRIHTTCFNGTTGNISDAMIVELPCLPFSPAEVFVPSSTKMLHLYEARFLALLDEVMGKYNNLFAHIIIEPMGPGRSDDDGKGTASFLATYGCLARVENVQRLDIGAAVTIRGIGRIKLIGLTQLEPFLKSTIVSLKDDAPKDEEAVAAALNELQATLNNVQELQIKLKVKNRPALDELDPIFQAEALGDEPLQTPLEKAIQWAKKGEPDNLAEAYVPSREERLSFAALQPVAGASPTEQHRLLQERLYAMEAMDTMQRLKRVTPYAEQTLANLAAKVALQSLNL